MKRTPLVYTPTEIKTWHVEEEYLPGKWRPARPCGFRGVKYFAMRVRIAWSVFIGKYDALNWQGTGEKPANKTKYRDCTEPGFGSFVHK